MCHALLDLFLIQVCTTKVLSSGRQVDRKISVPNGASINDPQVRVIDQEISLGDSSTSRKRDDKNHKWISIGNQSIIHKEVLSEFIGSSA